MFGNWRERGESDFTAGADGYLQGLMLTQQSQRGYLVGTDRRVAMLQGVTIKRGGALAAKTVPFSFAWSQVRSYYADSHRFALRIDDPDKFWQEVVIDQGAPKFGGWVDLCDSRGVPRED